MGFLAGFAPAGEVFVHQRMETMIMTGFQQMAQFMHHNVLHAPFWQQQRIHGDTDGTILYVALPPTRDGWLVTDSGRANTHFLGVALYHWLYQSL